MNRSILLCSQPFLKSEIVHCILQIKTESKYKYGVIEKGQDLGLLPS